MQPNFLIEEKYQNIAANIAVLGIDEAGRGPLAGPVVAACVQINSNSIIHGINDSKKLSKKARQKIFLELTNSAQFGVGIVEVAVIDEINILQATKLAMVKAFGNFKEKYSINESAVLIDGNFSPFNNSDKIKFKIIADEAVVKGDQKSISIAAASIIAKETRDQIMQEIHQQYPLYNFDKNAGYGTKKHLQAIAQHGFCAVHRKSFEPIKSMLNENN